MDNQKTGALIAARRAELGLTQKQLADRLYISDRTISKWERGSGFPDVSLLEPLADTLGLSVLEVLHGARMEAPQHGVETVIRDVTRTFGAKFTASFKRMRWALVIITVIALLSLGCVLHFWHSGYLDRLYIHTEEISASEALAICPFSLISTEDYEILQCMLSDKDLTCHLPEIYDDQHILKPEDIFSARDALFSRYEGLFRINGETAQLVSIDVIYFTVYVTYTRGPQHCILQVDTHSGTVTKTCTQYKDENRSDWFYIIVNQNNQTFSQARESSRLSLILSQ